MTPSADRAVEARQPPRARAASSASAAGRSRIVLVLGALVVAFVAGGWLQRSSQSSQPGDALLDSQEHATSYQNRLNEDLIFRLNPNRALSPDTRLDVGCFDTTCTLTLSAKGAPLVVQAARDGVSPRVEAYDDVGIALHIIADLAGNSLPGIRTFVFVLADPSGTSELRLTCRRDTLIASRNTQTPSNAQTRAAYLLGEARFANRLCYRQEWLTAT